MAKFLTFERDGWEQGRNGKWQPKIRTRVVTVPDSKVAQSTQDHPRRKWLNGKLAGQFSTVGMGKTGKISYKTVEAWAGGTTNSRTPQTRRGICEALNILGITCEFSEVPE